MASSLSPPLRGEVAVRSTKNRAASLARADGDERSERKRHSAQPVMVVINYQQFLLEFTHHPVRSTKEAARYLIDVADPPPRRGGEKAHQNGIPLTTYRASRRRR